MSDWERLEAEATAIIAARLDEYEDATRQNLFDLFRLLRSTDRPGPEIEPGWEPSFVVSWNLKGSENLEISVFSFRYEVWRFFEGETELWYEEHNPGDSFSNRFLKELPAPR